MALLAVQRWLLNMLSMLVSLWFGTSAKACFEYSPILLGSFEFVNVLVCDSAPPSVLLGRGVDCPPDSGVIVLALLDDRLNVFASGARCVSFNFLVSFLKLYQCHANQRSDSNLPGHDCVVLACQSVELR